MKNTFSTRTLVFVLLLCVAQLKASAQNNAPTATNLGTAETYTEDLVLNLVDMVVSDIDGDPLTVTLTLSNPIAGSLSTGTSGAVTSTYNAGTGIWKASGAIADLNALLAGVIFTPAANYNSNFTIATSVSDGIAPALTGSKLMTGIPVNDPPTATNLSAAEVYTEDVSLNLVDIVVSDIDNATLTVVLTLSDLAAGALSTGTSGAITSTYNPTTGVWTASGAIANLNTLLAGLTFIPSPNYNGNFSIATSVSDGIAPPVTGNKVITGIFVNDPPTATNLSVAEVYTEDVGFNLVGIVVSDIDNATLTVVLTLSDPAAGMLSSSGSGAFYNPATGVWTAIGAIANLNTLLAGLIFIPSPNYNSNFTIATSVSDGIAPAVTGNKVMIGIPVNDPPTATNLSAAEVYTEDVALNLIDIVVSDIDNAALTVTLTLTNPTAGTLSTGTSGVVTSTYNAVTGVWTAGGPIANVNTLLAGVSFTPATDYNSSFSIITSVSDGIAPAINGIKIVTGIPTNDAPVLDASLPQSIITTEDAPPPVGPVGSLVGAFILGISDVDAGSVNGIAVTGSDAANGTWYYSTNNGTTWTPLGAVSDASARLLAADALWRLYFQPSPNFYGTANAALTFRAWDQTSGVAGGLASTTTNGGITAFSAATDVIDVTVTPVNDPPTATNLSAAESYTEDNALNLVDIVVTDLDNTTLGVTLTLSDPAAGKLSTGTSGVVTSTYNAVTGVWTAGGPIADLNTLLAGVTFIPTGNYNSNFTIATSVIDGIAPAINGIKIVTGIPINDAPVLDPSPVLSIASTENNPAPFGPVGVSVIEFTDGITDVDIGALKGIAITGSNSANGTWFYSVDNGGSWLLLGPVSELSARLLAANPGSRLYFQPSSNFSGTVNAALTFRAWDLTNGFSGAIASATPNGGITAFSAATDAIDLFVVQVNNAPILDPSPALNMIVPANAPVPVGAMGSAVSEFTVGITDADPGALNGIAIIASDETNGSWYYSIDNGTNWLLLGALSDAAARLLPGSNARLYFKPSAGFNGIVNPGLSFRAWDQTSGVIAGIFPAIPNGGSTAYSVATDGIAVNVGQSNHAPVLTPALTLNVPEDAPLPAGPAGAAVNDFTGGIADIDPGTVPGIAITASDETNGSWYFSTDNGTNWLPLGAVSDGAARLLAGSNSRLYFRPNSNFNGTICAALSFRAWDQTTGSIGAVVSTIPKGGNTAFSEETDVIRVKVAPENDPPTATNLNAPETYVQNITLNLVDIVVADIDNASLTVTLTLSDPAAGSLSTATSGLVTSTYNAATGVWTASGLIADLNILLAGVSFVPAPDYYSNFTMATSVSDGIAPPVTGLKQFIGHADQDGDGYSVPDGDCDDNNENVHPGAVEVCNGIDDDCDGIIDNNVVDAVTWYQDADGDGFGNWNVSITACQAPPGFVADNSDCDDNNEAVHPGAVEICNGIDDDCDGIVDNNAVGMQLLYLDQDGDGWGTGAPFLTCPVIPGTAVVGGDCDDNNASIHPGAVEICNGIDDDCDGVIDNNAIDAPTWYEDHDGDGYGNWNVSITACQAPPGFVADNSDCDDNNENVHPGAIEICDGFDNDCNGYIDDNAVGMLIWYQDLDADGFGNAAVVIQACQAPPGFVADNSDCDDNNENVHPGAIEICDGLDNDCNGYIDDNAVGMLTWYQDLDADGFGNAAVVIQACQAPPGFVADNSDCDDNNENVHPGAIEICDGFDNDCNGYIDDNAVGMLTWYQDLDADGFGNAAVVIQACQAPPGYVADNTDCDDTNPVINIGPAQPSAISGPASACVGQANVLFSVSPVPGASSYVWTLPAGTTGSSTSNSISVSFNSGFTGGNICVIAMNSCGSSASVCKTLTSYSIKPVKPGPIAGNALVLAGATELYSVAPVADATQYQWIVPVNSVIVNGQGTNTVSVKFGSAFSSGTLEVYAINCVGSSAAQKLSIKVQKAPKPLSANVVVGSSTIIPNPADKLATVAIPLETDASVRISVVDVAGRTAAGTIGRELKAGNNAVKLDVSRLANGLYFVEVFQNDKKTIHKLMIRH